jgi:hypothetical protein
MKVGPPSGSSVLGDRVPRRSAGCAVPGWLAREPPLWRSRHGRVVRTNYGAQTQPCAAVYLVVMGPIRSECWVGGVQAGSPGGDYGVIT